MSDGRCPSCQADVGFDAFEPVEINYEEALNSAMESQKRRSDDSRRRAASREISFGVFLVVVGAAIDVVSYAAAPSSPGGGAYILWTGPILIGLTMIFRGTSKR